MINYSNKKSLLNNNWQIKDLDERYSLMIAQRNNLHPILSKLLTLRNIKNDEVDNFLYPNFLDNLPDPFILKDMKKSVDRTIEAINNNQKIGIVADYDVDGSTSAAILCNFFNSLNLSYSIKIPKRLSEGYGPNFRIMDEFINEKIDLIFTLDCGTSSFKILNHKNYINQDIIVLDHHISESKLPNIYSIVNPNRFDENNYLNNLAAVGVTFLFIMGLRKILRERNYFNKEKKEPNLLNFLDLVALGTICDVVNLDKYNRNLVIKGLEILKQRKNISLKKMIDNSHLNHSPSSKDLAFIIGPQLNSASRIDDSSLSSKLLITNKIEEIEIISKKLILLNEKRKIIENSIFEQAIEQTLNQKNSKILFVKGFGWHKGVLGIIASKLVEKFNKPSIVLSTDNNIGIGSARSIDKVDLATIILDAKKNKLLIDGGGHKMAAGFKIDINLIHNFQIYLNNIIQNYDNNIFDKTDFYDLKLSVNEINEDLMQQIEKLEPFGKGNEEPKFILYDINIDSYKIIKEKHLLIFFSNNFDKKIKAISFNCIGTPLGEYLMSKHTSKIEFGCQIKRDNYNFNFQPQIIIKDAFITN